MIAESIIGAAKELGSFRVPMVVRLQGTNSEEALQMVSLSKPPSRIILFLTRVKDRKRWTWTAYRRRLWRGCEESGRACKTAVANIGK